MDTVAFNELVQDFEAKRERFKQEGTVESGRPMCEAHQRLLHAAMYDPPPALPKRDVLAEIHRFFGVDPFGIGR